MDKNDKDYIISITNHTISTSTDQIVISQILLYNIYQIIYQYIGGDKIMNIGIISTSKKLSFQDLPNNTYLVFYISKAKKNKNYLDSIINYMIANDCKEIIVAEDMEPLIEKNNYKNINVYNKLSNIKTCSTNKKVITYNFSIKDDNSISFEKSASFRKDCSPNETIRKIKRILKKEHYKVKEKGLRKSLRGSYSIRLQLNNGKGVNGKGTTLKLAKASAYAELMERLQSNMLIKKRVATHKIDKNSNIYNSLLDKASNEYKKYFFTLDNIYFNVEKAKNIKTNNIENIPINAISSFCHTNGLASGNTFEEAVNQGIFEILERFCYQECLKGDNPIPNIDISKYPLTKNNIKLLKSLKKKGFKYYIKDCSLGKFPVIGFLLFDKKEEKYSFTMGSDISFNIALSRCITEMMQGVNFKELEQKMVSNQTFEALEKKYDNSFKSYNWLKCFNNNNGYLTKNFFYNDYIQISELHFKDYLTDNKEVLEYLKSLIDKDIYTIDYNNLGFNTYRVYIPYMTSVDCYDIEDLIINKNYDKLKHIYTNTLNASNNDISYFTDTFLKISKSIKYDELIKPSDLFHIDEISDYYKLDFTSLLIVLSSLCSKTAKLKKYLKYKIDNIPLNKQKKLTYKIIINCIENKKIYDINDDHIYNYIKNIFDNPKAYLISLNPIVNNKESLIYNKKAN